MGTPAEAAGATPGSLVVEIDGMNAERMSHDQLIAALRASGECLVLTLATSYNTEAGSHAPGDNGGLPDYLPKRVEAGAIIASITPARNTAAGSRVQGGSAAAVFSPISAMKALPDTPLPELSPERSKPAAGTGAASVAASPERQELQPTTLFATVGSSPSRLGDSNVANSLRFRGLHTISVQRTAADPSIGLVLHDNGGASGCQVVDGVTEGRAAARAGAKRGEMLVTVGGVNVDGLNHDAVVALLSASDPTQVLTLQFATQYISNPQAIVSLELKRKARGGQ